MEGLGQVSSFGDLKAKLDAKELALRTQGHFDKDALIKKLKFDPATGKAATTLQSWLKDWIQKSPEQEVRGFLEYLSGARHVPDQDITIHLSDEFAPDGGVKVSTCALEAWVHPSLVAMGSKKGKQALIDNLTFGKDKGFTTQ